VIIADTSGLLSAFGHDTRMHRQARAAYEHDSGPVILSPFVLAEVDYMILQRVGIGKERELLREVAGGVYELAEFGCADVARATEVVEQYRDLRIGLADASIVVLAARYRTSRVLTLDHRHFRAMRSLDGGSFTILPGDGG
jgi:uncharacterized protein